MRKKNFSLVSRSYRDENSKNVYTCIYIKFFFYNFKLTGREAVATATAATAAPSARKPRHTIQMKVNFFFFSFNTIKFTLDIKMIFFSLVLPTLFFMEIFPFLFSPSTPSHFEHHKLTLNQNQLRCEKMKKRERDKTTKAKKKCKH